MTFPGDSAESFECLPLCFNPSFTQVCALGFLKNNKNFFFFLKTVNLKCCETQQGYGKLKKTSKNSICVHIVCCTCGNVWPLCVNRFSVPTLTWQFERRLLSRVWFTRVVHESTCTPSVYLSIRAATILASKPNFMLHQSRRKWIIKCQTRVV